MPVPLDLDIKNRTEAQLLHIQDRISNSFSLYSWSYFQEDGLEIDYDYLKELVAVTPEIFLYEELILSLPEEYCAVFAKYQEPDEVTTIRNQLPKPGPEYVEFNTKNTFVVNGFFKENSEASITYKFKLSNLRHKLFYTYAGIKEIKF